MTAGASGYSHPLSLAGRVAIVTGAAQGMDKGIAQALLDRGAAVFAGRPKSRCAERDER